MLFLSALESFESAEFKFQPNSVEPVALQSRHIFQEWHYKVADAFSKSLVTHKCV